MAIDPWRHTLEGMDTLYAAREAKKAQERQAAFDALNLEKGQMSLDAARALMGKQQALESYGQELAGQTQTAPNPELGGAAYKLGAGPLRPEVQTPLSQQQQSQMLGKKAQELGLYDQAKDFTDITNKLNAQQLAMHEQIVNIKATQGTEAAKTAAIMMGAPNDKVAAIDQLEVTPTGEAIQTLPDGSQIYSVIDPATMTRKMFHSGSPSAKTQEKWSDPYEKDIGGKKVMVQQSLTTGQVRQIAAGPTGAGGMPADDEIQGWAEAVRTGRAELKDVPAGRGANSPRTKVVAYLEKQAAGSGKDPVDYTANTAENKALQSSITAQEKAIGAMGSFVRNIAGQIDRVKTISKDLASYDARILNLPLRAARGRIAGSPDQAKFDMYLTEIESEIGKLATGSAQSISELSVGAQEKWAKIHDKNLSMKDMLSLLEETKHAAQMRYDSVNEQLVDTKKRMRTRSVEAGKTLDAEKARGFLEQAAGDKAKARELARKAGYQF